MKGQDFIRSKLTESFVVSLSAVSYFSTFARASERDIFAIFFMTEGKYSLILAWNSYYASGIFYIIIQELPLHFTRGELVPSSTWNSASSCLLGQGLELMGADWEADWDHMHFWEPRSWVNWERGYAIWLLITAQSQVRRHILDRLTSYS